MNKNAQAYFNSAKRLGMSVTEIDYIEGFNLVFANQNYYFSGSITPINNGASVILSANKYFANKLMMDAGIPVPKAAMIEADEFSLDKLKEYTSHLKFPVVIKPMAWSTLGADVICNIPNLQELYISCEKQLKLYSSLSIEEFHGNLNAFRVLVYKNKILDVIARYPASVVGNGYDSLRVLVETTNDLRKEKSNFYAPIRFDYEAHLRLREQSLTEESIISKGKVVYLAYACNATRGGTIKSISKSMCKENKELILKVTKVLNLDLAGIDVQCRSLDEPMIHGNGVIIEANYNPSMRIHEEGVGGVKRLVTRQIMMHFIYKHPIAYFFTLFKSQAHQKIMLSSMFFIILLVFSVIFFNIKFY